MNEYGALVEWDWQGKPEVLEEKTCPSAISSTTNPTWTGLVPKPGLRLSQARLFSQIYSIKRTEFNVWRNCSDDYEKHRLVEGDAV